ncbi:MAG: ankyrin repeat domain-containing protein, partial [Betaproteobacteria bacterium]
MRWLDHLAQLLSIVLALGMTCAATNVSAAAEQDLYAAASAGNVSRVKELLDAKADVNAKDAD